MKKDYEEDPTVSYSDVVEKLGHEFDDVAVLGWLGLQQLLDHHNALSHHRLCKGHTADFHAKLRRKVCSIYSTPLVIIFGSETIRSW